MTQLDELLRQHSQRIPVDDAVEREALDHARHTLRAAAASEHARARRRRSPRHVGRLTLIAGVAATIAAMVAFLPGPTGNDASQLGPATASAQSLLRQVARAISRHAWQPLRPGQYFYFRQIGDSGHNGPASARPGTVQDVWIGANGFARIVQTGPDTVIAGGDVLIFHATPQQLQAERQRQRNGAHLRILAYSQKYRWVDLDYQQLIRLPTDPSKLQRYVEHHATGGGPRFSDMFSYAENLLIGAPVPPKVSAAMYHVIARLPGMRLIGPTHDLLGRPGVAVGLFFKDQPGRIELIFNPTTGVLLGERGVSLNASKMHAPVGSIVDWSAIDRQRVVNSDHQVAATTTARGDRAGAGAGSDARRLACEPSARGVLALRTGACSASEPQRDTRAPPPAARNFRSAYEPQRPTITDRRTRRNVEARPQGARRSRPPTATASGARRIAPPRLTIPTGERPPYAGRT